MMSEDTSRETPAPPMSVPRRPPPSARPDARHRYSWNGGPLYPSVTTILGIKDKPALVGWAKRETAACAVRNLDVLERMVRSGGPQAAVDWLKRIPDYARDASADLGSAVHAAAEAIARGEPAPVAEDVGPFVAAYRRDFLEAFQPRFIAVEAMVCSRATSTAARPTRSPRSTARSGSSTTRPEPASIPTPRSSSAASPGPSSSATRRPDPVPRPLRHPLRRPPHPARGCPAPPRRRESRDRGRLPRRATPLRLGPGSREER